MAVFNWPRQAEVEVDLATAGLKQGERFEIRDVQDWFGQPLVSGVYDGERVKLPMHDRQAAAPLGKAPVSPPHTAPEFGAFVVLPRTNVE